MTLPSLTVALLVVAAERVRCQETRAIYVRADTGRDANDGLSPGTALRTIGAAALLAAPGDRVVVGPGLYHEGDIHPAAFGRVSLIADSSGTEVGAAPGPVVVDATGHDTGFELNHNLAVTVAGFVVYGAVNGIYVKSESHQSQVINNIVTENNGHGIYVQDSNQTLVFNNLVYRNHKVGILIAADTLGSSRTAVINNTVYANEDRGIFFSGTVLGSPGGLVLNNAVESNEGNNSTGIQVNSSSLPGYVSAGNVSVDRFPNGTPVDATDRRVPMVFASDPSGPDTILGGSGFADDDFHLSQVAAGQPEDSAAVDAGVLSAAAVALSGASTRTDRQPDDGWVDAGYHYGNAGTTRIPPLAELRYVSVYVDASLGNDANSGATPATPLRSLQMALEMARAGTRVVLAAGTYQEGDLIPRVSGPGGRDLAIVGAAGTVIDAGAYDRGLLIEGGGSVSLTDLAITGARIAAVQVRNTSGAELTRVSLSANAGNGLWVQDDSVVSVSGSRLDRNRRVGVRNENGNVTVNDCTVCGNCQEGVRTRGGTLQVVDSIVERGKNDGISVFGATEFTLVGTMVGNNLSTGVQVNQADSASIMQSVLFSNGGPGLRLFDVPGPVIWNNLVYNNGSSGALISGDVVGSPGAQLLNNTFYQNANRGVLLGGSDVDPPSAMATVLRNIFQGNAVAGLQVNRRSRTGYTGDYNLNADAYGSGTPVGEHDVIGEALFVDADGAADDGFRLKQLAAGQDTQSPAVDAGGIDAVTAGVEHLTTRTDNVTDSGIADLGYHSPPGSLLHCDVDLSAPSCEPEMPADCDGDGRITVSDLILGVNIALGQLSLDQCPSFDQNGDGRLNINELLGAVASALEVASIDVETRDQALIDTGSPPR